MSLPDQPSAVRVNLLNLALVVNGTCTTVEFQGVGPTAGFLCQLDNGQFESCELCSMQFTSLKRVSISYLLHMFLDLNS